MDAQKKLFKVLMDGKSCHRGSLEWSLPKDGRPGEWHEVTGPLEPCSNGFHLTDAPAEWWVPRASAFEVEAEEIVGDIEEPGHKVVARRVRLLRELSKEGLAQLNVFLDGMSGSVSAGKAWASGSASVRASGSASVEAFDNASVRASGSASVEAFDNASVRASGSASVEADQQVTVISWWGTPTVAIRDRALHIDRRGAGPPKISKAKKEKAE